MDRSGERSARPVLLHVATADAAELVAAAARGPVVLVEPLYGCPAVLAALDAGWDAVELAAEEAGAAPVPLVSWEQVPPTGATTCRVRCDDLHAAALELVSRGVSPVLAAPVNARPAMSRVALELAHVGGDAAVEQVVVTFVPAPALHDGHGAEPGDAALGERLTRDAWWACGMLLRVLLEELEDVGRDARLDDSAGIAVSVAGPGEDAAAALRSSARLAQHLARGGHPDDVRVASALDAYGVVARLERGSPPSAGEEPVLVARWWVPAPAAVASYSGS